MFFSNRHIALRPLTEDDLNQVYPWINDPKVSQCTMATYPMGREQERDWLRNAYQNREKRFALGIELPGDNPVLIGIMGLHNINHLHGTAETVAMIGSQVHQGKGFGSHAKMLLLHYAFSTLNLRRITSSVIAFNGLSASYNQKCGYEVIGRQPGMVYKNGQYWDLILFLCQREKWQPRWEHYERTGGEFLPVTD